MTGGGFCCRRRFLTIKIRRDNNIKQATPRIAPTPIPAFALVVILELSTLEAAGETASGVEAELIAKDVVETWVNEVVLLVGACVTVDDALAAE